MQQWVACSIVVLGLGCGKKETPATAGSAAAKPVAGSAATVVSLDAAVGSDAAVAADAAQGSAASAAAAPGDCMPSGLRHFARLGADLVACQEDDAKCWTIDPMSGAVAPHAATHLPGVGFTVDADKLAKPNCYEDLCWTPRKSEGDDDGESANSGVWVAYHPDGKRVAIMDVHGGTIFDLATKQPIATFASEISNSLGGLWFTGRFVVEAGYDAGPYAVLVYHDAKTGKKVGQFDEFYEGGAGVTSTGALIVAGEDTTTLSVVDGKSWKGKTTTRKIPKPPADCSPEDPALDRESDDPKVKACVAFFDQHYEPYAEAVFIDDPAGAFLGFNGRELVTVDKKLNETSRVKLAVCPPSPDDN